MDINIKTTISHHVVCERSVQALPKQRAFSGNQSDEVVFHSEERPADSGAQPGRNAGAVSHAAGVYPASQLCIRQRRRLRYQDGQPDDAAAGSQPGRRPARAGADVCAVGESLRLETEFDAATIENWHWQNRPRCGRKQQLPSPAMAPIASSPVCSDKVARAMLQRAWRPAALIIPAGFSEAD
jgi:hypothetical protein